jgi:SmpA / OmlA family
MRSLIIIAALAASAVALPAQTAKIDPGMTKDQVVASLGEPLSARSRNGFTYLLYQNGCEKKCGMHDLVVLDSGKVIDAVFRSTSREYSGTSSSPRMISQPEAKKDSLAGAPLKIAPASAKTPPDPKTPSPDPLR